MIDNILLLLLTQCNTIYQITQYNNNDNNNNNTNKLIVSMIVVWLWNLHSHSFFQLCLIPFALWISTPYSWSTLRTLKRIIFCQLDTIGHTEIPHLTNYLSRHINRIQTYNHTFPNLQTRKSESNFLINVWVPK